MALEYGLYLSPVIGAGVPGDHLRGKVTQYVVCDGSGMDYWDWIHDGRSVRYGLVCAEPAIHAQLLADGQILPLSPQMPTVAALEAWMASLSGQLPAAMQAILRLDGCAPEQVAGASTIRHLWEALRETHVRTSHEQMAARVVGSGEDIDPMAVSTMRLRLGPLEF